MRGIFYNTIGIKKRIEPKLNGSTIFICIKGHATNYLSQQRKHLKNGRIIIKEVCPVCNGMNSTIASQLKSMYKKDGTK